MRCPRRGDLDGLVFWRRAGPERVPDCGNAVVVEVIVWVPDHQTGVIVGVGKLGGWLATCRRMELEQRVKHSCLQFH